MQPDIPVLIYYSFITLSVIVFSLFTREVSRKFPDNKMYVFGIIFWFVLQYILGKVGFFADSIGEFPPRIMVVIVPTIILLFYIAFSSVGKNIAEKSDLLFLTAIQSFRFPLELILWQLADQNLLPSVMSFEGRNFDVFVGMTSPFIAYLYLKGKIGLREMKLWNIAGLILVSNVVVHGMLTVPAIELIPSNVPNFIVSYAPFNLLPGGLVPLAYLFHILSLRKLADVK